MMIYSWKIFRYLFQKSLFWFVMVSLGMSALVLVLDVSDLIRRVSDIPNIRWNLVLRISLLKIPYLYTQILPFILLFSSIICLWLLNRSRELTALKAVGVSFRQILFPFCVLGLLVGVADIGVFNPVSRFLWGRHLLMDARFLQQKDQLFLISEKGIWTRMVENKTPKIYRIDRLNRDSGELHQISIFVFDTKGFRLQKHYDAVRAKFVREGMLLLEKVWESNGSGIPTFYEQLEVPTKLRKKDLEDQYLNPRYLSIGKIIDVINILEKSGLNNEEYQLHLHAEIARMFIFVLLCLIGGVFMMRPPRESKSYVQASLALFLGFFLYVLKDFLYAMGLGGYIPLLLAAWVPVALQLMLPLSLLIHYEEGQ